VPDRPGRAGTVTITGDGIPLGKALEQVESQSGVRIVNLLGADDEPKLKLDLRDASFWEAVDRIADAADAQLELYRADGQVALVRRYRDRNSPLKPVISRHGPFRVSLRKLSAHNHFTTGARGYTGYFEVAWEPGIQPYFLQTIPQKLVVQDDRGRKVPGGGGSSWERVKDPRAASFDVALPALPRATARGGVLSGEFALRGPGRIATFRFPAGDSKDATLADLDAVLTKTGKPVTVSAGEGMTTCSLEQVKLGVRAWSVEIRTTLPASGPDFSSHETWYANNEAYLLALDGKTRLYPTGLEHQVGDARKAVTVYHFADSPAGRRGAATDWTLVFRAPASMVERAIPFEFRDVPLP
jgi:hypothetical protein